MRIVAGTIWQKSNNRMGIKYVMKYIHINPEAGNGGQIILSVKGQNKRDLGWNSFRES